MKFELALLELYSPLKHGILQPNSASLLYGNYMIIERIDIDKFYKKQNSIFRTLRWFKRDNNNYIDKLKYEMNITNLHPFIRNYDKIVKNPKHYKIEIIEPINISIGKNEWDIYNTAIIKTHWISLIQRRWRKFQKERKNAIRNLINLKHREITGSYPTNCVTKFKLGI
jgi:hypothetical protein